MTAVYGFLLATGVATELDLAWTHDGWRLAGCSIALVLVWMLRKELLRKPPQ